MKIAAVRDRALVRLIPATYHKPPVLRGLVDNEAEAQVLAELEGETSARLQTERQGSPGLDRRELAFVRQLHDFKVYAETQINAAFTYTRPGGNRFNDGERGAWYCAWHVLTSAHEVGFHRTRELGYIGVYQDEARYIELLADFIGDFPDLHEEPGHPALDPDPETGYPRGQALAEALRRAGHRGLVYPSVRQKGGRCFVAFDPAIVQNVRPGATWQLTWRGSPAFSVEALDAAAPDR